MTDFDEQLRSRLERLDAAVPGPAHPVTDRPNAATGAALSKPRRRGRRAVVLMAAAALLLVTSAVTANRLLFPEEMPHPELEAALADIFADQDCINAAEANGLIRAELDAIGYAGWTIESQSGADSARCVGAGVIGAHHVVALFPGTGQALADALEAAGDELLRQCLNREEAIAFLSSVVTAAGETDFTIHADPLGPEGAPTDQYEAYERHAAEGCYVRVPMVGRDEEGRAMYYLWGD